MRDKKLRADERKRAVLYRQVNRHVMVPLRMAMRLVLRWQGLIAREEEERAELERLRREARAAGKDESTSKSSNPKAQGVAAPVHVAPPPGVRAVQPTRG